MHGRKDELFLLRSGEDLIEIDRHAQGDKEEPADARPDPVRRLEGRGCDELRPE